MEPLGTEPGEESQNAMQLLIRDLVLAGMIIEGTQGAIQEVLQRHPKCPSTLDIDRMFSKP